MPYPFSLPDLEYAFDALEPHIDARTMEIHHDKHHAAYLTNLNKALEPHPGLHGKSVEELLRSIDAVPDAIRGAVRNHGGGYANHNLFWKIMSPAGGGEPAGALAEAIAGKFGSFADFKAKLTAAAGGQFGSGWGWLVVDGSGGLGRVRHAEPGQPAHEGAHPDPGRGRLGACLLPELPEPPAGLPRGLVEHGELGGGAAAVRRDPLIGGPRLALLTTGPVTDLATLGSAADRRSAVSAAGGTSRRTRCSRWRRHRSWFPSAAGRGRRRRPRPTT